ncbi:MAG: flagellar biosynthesis protein FliQ [Gammaproteobacteria bacterium]
MDSFFIEIAQETIWVLLKISLPILLVALIVGLVISLFQALTQIQEPTLSFVPKIVAIFFTLMLLFNFIGSTMKNFSDQIMSRIVNIDEEDQ